MAFKPRTNNQWTVSNIPPEVRRCIRAAAALKDLEVGEYIAEVMAADAARVIREMTGPNGEVLT